MDKKVSKEVLSKVEDYVRAGTIENEAIRKALTEIAVDLGLSSTTVHRAVRMLKAEGIVSIAPPKVPGLPQEISYLAASKESDAGTNVRLALGRVRAVLSEIESELDKVSQENRALREELAVYRDQNERIESKTVLDDGRVILVLRALVAQEPGGAEV